MKKLLFVVAIAALGISCTTMAPQTIGTGSTTDPSVWYYQKYGFTESMARMLEPELIMLLTPLAADLNVSSEKITYIEKDAFSHLRIDDHTISNLDEYKKLALTNASNAYQADVIVGATINVTTEDNKLVIQVSGYPATFANFRNATIRDTELLKAAYPFKNELGLEILGVYNEEAEELQ